MEGVRLLVALGLAAAVLPEIVPADATSHSEAQRALEALGRLQAPGFPLALATLLAPRVDAAAVREVGLRWRLSNKETDEAAWLVERRDALAAPQSMRWSKLQPLLAHPWAGSLVALHEASSPQGAEEGAYRRQLLTQPRDRLDPPPLVSGDDLQAIGLRPGPKFKAILQTIRDVQLDGEVQTREEALRLAQTAATIGG